MAEEKKHRIPCVVTNFFEPKLLNVFKCAWSDICMQMKSAQSLIVFKTKILGSITHGKFR